MTIKKLAKEVAALIVPLHLEIARTLPNPLAKERITFPQMAILTYLDHAKQCKMSDLSKMLGVTKSAITGVIDRLLKTGFINRLRSKGDRRVVNVKLTKKGKRTAKQLANFKLKVIIKLFANINAKERVAYLHILRKMHNNITAKKIHA